MCARIYPPRKTGKFPFPVNRRKRGEIHPETGLIFDRYNRSPYGCTEWWVSKEKFDAITKNSRERRRIAYWKDHEKTLEQKRMDKINNPERVLEEARRSRKKIRSSPIGRLICNYRSRTSDFLTERFGRSKTTQNAIGCSLEKLKEHLEAMFLPGMTWENYGRGNGKWSVDHIIPLISSQTVERLMELLHYTNLQPLWYFDNIKKGSMMPDGFKFGKNGLDQTDIAITPPSGACPIAISGVAQ